MAIIKTWMPIFLLPILITTNVIAQDVSEEQSESKLDGVIKISGISPAVGASYQIGQGEIRALTFFSTEFYRSGTNNRYFLDVSYLRDNNWIESESIQTYWGIDMSVMFEDPMIGPGGIIGTTYSLNERFAIFGEVGLNVFIYDEGTDAVVGMFNSGIGLKLAL